MSGARSRPLDRTSSRAFAASEHGLADEVVLIVYPVLLGAGKRLFAEGTPPCSLALLSTSAFPSGVVLNTYKVLGPLKP